MPRYWTCHWQNKFWRPDINSEYKPIDHAATNVFRKRGVEPGDVVYILSLADGQLYLGGKVTVKVITSYRSAVKILGTENIYDAEDHLIGYDGSPLNLRRRLSPDVSKQIYFNSGGKPKGLFFVSETHLDVQATRGVRELTADSAAFLDRIIEATDRLPQGQTIVVTMEMLNDGMHSLKSSDDDTLSFQMPEEIVEASSYPEGSVIQVFVNRYERSKKARSACIDRKGTNCIICGFNFRVVYGEAMDGFIHVHHVTPISEIADHYKVSVDELEPVCPNCHAVIHSRKNPPYSIAEVKQMLEDAKCNDNG